MLLKALAQLGEKIIVGAASYQSSTGFADVPSPPRTYGVAINFDI